MVAISGDTLVVGADGRQVGTTFSFTLDQTATVSLRFARETPGRSAHGRCAPPTANNKRAARCTRTITAGVLNLTAPHAVRGVAVVAPP